MVVEVPAGRTASLALSQGVERVKVYAQPTGGDSIDLPLTLTNTALRGSTTFTYWIDAVAPSESMADIAFTLTTSDAGPASSDTVRATAMATDVVAHRTGDFYGQPLSELHEDRRDPNEFIVLTNNDFDAAALVPDERRC